MENINEELSGMQLISKELETAKGNEKIIGEMILKEFPDSLNGLEKAWKTRGLTLAKLWGMILSEARENLKGKSGAVDDQTVLGWVNHLIIDGKIPDDKKNPLNPESEGEDDDGDSGETNSSNRASSKADKKSKKQKKASLKDPKKADKSESPFIQLSLFDLTYGKSESAQKEPSK
jgi:hypothetical protein